MIEENLADLHNRNKNLAYVVQRCQNNYYPLIVWPEDQFLIRLADLPLVIGRPVNIPSDWQSIHWRRTQSFTSDQAFRDWLIIGNCYFRTFQHHSGLSIVQEYYPVMK